MSTIRTLVTMLLVCGGAFGQDAPADSDQVDGIDKPVWGGEALQRELALNERQIERLTEIDHAREDEIFPLAREWFEKDWALRRAWRADEPDEATVKMLEEDLQRIYSDVQGVNSRHRAASHAVLSSHQIAALARLERAFDALPAAQEAYQTNLIGEPAGAPVNFLPFGLPSAGVVDAFSNGGLLGLLGLFAIPRIDMSPPRSDEEPRGEYTPGSPDPGERP